MSRRLRELGIDRNVVTHSGTSILDLGKDSNEEKRNAAARRVIERSKGKKRKEKKRKAIMTLFSVLLAVLMFACGALADSDVLLKPLSKMGKPSWACLLQGTQISAAAYEPLMQAVQEAPTTRHIVPSPHSSWMSGTCGSTPKWTVP